MGYKAYRGPFGRLHRSTGDGGYIPSAEDSSSMSEPEQVNRGRSPNEREI